jgi:hypothetical protein
MWVNYVAAGVLTLSLGMHLARKPKLEKVSLVHVDRREVEELKSKVSRLEIDLFHARKFQSTSRETIKEVRVDGSRIEIVREFEQKEETIAQSQSTETSKEEQKSIEVSEKRTENNRETTTDNSGVGSRRLGLDVGVSGQVDLQTLRPSLHIDGHYELWGRFGPTVGIVVSPTFTEIRGFSVGIRINL